jgi:hypothetical protein
MVAIDLGECVNPPMYITYMSLIYKSCGPAQPPVVVNAVFPYLIVDACMPALYLHSHRLACSRLFGGILISFSFLFAGTFASLICFE